MKVAMKRPSIPIAELRERLVKHVTAMIGEHFDGKPSRYRQLVLNIPAMTPVTEFPGMVRQPENQFNGEYVVFWWDWPSREIDALLHDIKIYRAGRYARRAVFVYTGD